MNILTTLLISIALSMDAFSLSIIYGTIGIEKIRKLVLSIIVGIYHFIMPIIGSFFGKLILLYIPIKTNILVGSIFLIISIQMFLSLKNKEEITTLNSFISLLLFGFSVSIDSLSVGITLNTISKYIILPPIVFSLTSFSFTFLGLTIGKILNKNLGKISIIIGATILFLLSLYYLFI